MSNDELKQLRDAIDAHLRGEPVQYGATIDGRLHWVDAVNATFDSRFQWRPKPKEPLRYWAIVTGNPETVSRSYSQRYYALHNCPSGGRVAEFVEVM